MYQAIYRKWRPLTFDDMVGQEHITTTLRNQVINNRVGHAYLFCGTRGTGKTTAAKVLARAVNCSNPINGSPCNECEICRGLMDGSIPDVTEIDAASNTGVDNIRELKEDTKFSTTLAKYHVYIIDEVHMLSQNAFNALLKTLEEPPSHIIFILATTEPQKIPQTILSRCQRYDFRRIRPFEITARLKEIAYGEGLKLTDGAYATISRLADGSMRDALSLLERVVSSCGDEISEANIIDILGIASVDTEFAMADAVIDKSTSDVFNVMASVIDAGRDLHVFMDSLIAHFRNLLVCKLSQTPAELIDYSDEDIARFKAQAQRVEFATITNIIRILTQSRADAKWLKSPRISYEVALVKLCQPALDVSSDAVSDRLSTLEGKLDAVNKKIKDGIKVAVEKPTPRPEAPKPQKAPSRRLFSPVPKEKLNSDNPLVGVVKNWNKTVTAMTKNDASLLMAIGDRDVTFDNDGIILIFKRAELFAKQIAEKRINEIKNAFRQVVGIECEIKMAFLDEIEDYMINVWELRSAKPSGVEAQAPTTELATPTQAAPPTIEVTPPPQTTPIHEDVAVVDVENEPNISESATEAIEQSTKQKTDPLDSIADVLGDVLENTDDKEFLEYKDEDNTFEQAGIDLDEDDDSEEFLEESEVQEDN